MPVTVEIPESVADALGALSGGALVLAGGTHVMPRIANEAHDVTTLVSLRRAGLAGISVEGRDVTIGAATTLAQVGGDARLAFLAPVIESIASPSIRNLATVGGNLFVAQPYGDLAVALLALDAKLDVAGAGGSAIRCLEEVLGAGLAPGELVTAVHFTVPEPSGWHYAKAMRRRMNSASIVTVAVGLALDAGVVTAARVALGGAGSQPVRATAAEAALVGGALDRERAEAAGRAALEDAEPFTDAYASAWYRARVLPVHVRRALIGQ